MHAHYLQHVPFEGPGSIETWLKRADYDITHTQLFTSPVFPSVDEIDLLIVMGGPMSVNDENAYPWLIQEKAFIRNIIESGKPVLGICLGAQLIASAMGASVYPNPHKEIGWFPIQGARGLPTSCFQFTPMLNVFHWHGETFDLPSGATRLASSEGCKNQAFQLGQSVIGLQFHLEATPESARDLANHCRDELVSSTYTQTESEILKATPEHYRAINSLMDNVLDWMQRSFEEDSQ